MILQKAQNHFLTEILVLPFRALCHTTLPLSVHTICIGCRAGRLLAAKNIALLHSALAWSDLPLSLERASERPLGPRNQTSWSRKSLDDRNKMHNQRPSRTSFGSGLGNDLFFVTYASRSLTRIFKSEGGAFRETASWAPCCLWSLGRAHATFCTSATHKQAFASSHSNIGTLRHYS